MSTSTTHKFKCNERCLTTCYLLGVANINDWKGLLCPGIPAIVSNLCISRCAKLYRYNKEIEGFADTYGAEVSVGLPIFFVAS